MENTNFQTHKDPTRRIRFCRVARAGRSDQNVRCPFGSQDCQRLVAETVARASHIQYLPDLPKALPELPPAHRLTNLRQDLSVVRSQPIIVRIAGRGRRVFFFQWIAIGITVLTVCYCLLRIADRFAALQATDAHRSKAIESLNVAIKEEDSRLESKRDEVNELGRYLLNSTSVAAPRRSSSEERQLDKALGIIQQLLAANRPSSESSKRSAAIDSLQSVPTDSADNNREGETSETYHFDATIPLISGAVIHRRTAGEADYWLVARPDRPGLMDRVIPFATTERGVAVHSISDSHEYIITGAGNWLKFGL